MKNNKGQSLLYYAKKTYGSLLHIEIYLPMKFEVDTSDNFCVMLPTKYKYKNKQRAITPKLCKRELLFLYTALIDIEIYLPLNFGVDISYSFLAMLWSK